LITPEFVPAGEGVWVFPPEPEENSADAKLLRLYLASEAALSEPAFPVICNLLR
jgi:hypothetical protein